MYFNNNINNAKSKDVGIKLLVVKERVRSGQI